MAEAWAIILVLIACVIGAAGALFLKKAAARISGLKSLFNLELMLGAVFYGAATLLFIPALKGGELSVLYPFVATSYIWVSLLSIKFLKEKMNKFKWLGILLIIFGVVLIGLGS